MTIHLPEDLENSVRVAVLKGQFASEDDLVAAAVRAYLRPQQDAANGAKSDRHAGLTNQEMQQRLLAVGLISEVFAKFLAPLGILLMRPGRGDHPPPEPSVQRVARDTRAFSTNA